MEVAEAGFTRILHAILDIGSAYLIHASNNYGETTLHIAVKNGRLPVVMSLLKRGVQYDAVNYKGQTACHVISDTDISAVFVQLKLLFDAVTNDIFYTHRLLLV